MPKWSTSKKDLSVKDGRRFYAYRGKGGKRGRRELPTPAYAAIALTLADCAKQLTNMRADEPLWQAGTGEPGITSGTIYLRHSAAKLRRDAGESIESVSQFLDHSSLAVTTVYLQRLEAQIDQTSDNVALAIGLSGSEGYTRHDLTHTS